MATITSSGTWTPLSINFSKTPKTGPNTLVADRMSMQELNSVDVTEITQFVQAMSDGYGITFNAAKQLFFHLVTAFMNRETPAVSRGYAA